MTKRTRLILAIALLVSGGVLFALVEDRFYGVMLILGAVIVWMRQWGGKGGNYDDDDDGGDGGE